MFGRWPLTDRWPWTADSSVRPPGLVTYDDSNLVIGGTGKVNAQIGDSDSGGAVVMGTANSDVEAGPSS